MEEQGTVDEQGTSPESTPVVDHFDRLSTTGAWSRLYEVADGSSYHAHVRRQRVLELLPQKLGHVVDVGCGPGVMVDAVRERGGTFHGIDLSTAMVEEAQARYGHLPGVTFQVGDIESLDLSDSSCDQVLCMGVIEYLGQSEKAMAEMARILRPGGVAVITIPKRHHIDRVAVAALTPIRAAARRVGLPGSDRLPRLCLQPDELDSVATRAGLVPDGGAQYNFTLLPYPFTRLLPGATMRVNLPFERWHDSRDPVRSFFGHGYVGRYRKQ